MSRKLKWSGLAVLAVVLSLALIGCGGGGGGGAASAKGGRILIGGALCLTGIQAPLDEPAVRGAQLAVEEINKKGGVLGRQLEFVNLDGKSDPVTVGNVAVELIKRGAKAIIAPSDFDFGGPASREAQKAGIVGISPAASSPLYGSKTLGDKQFTMSMWNTTMGAATAEFAYKQKGWKVGYVLAARELMREFRKVHQFNVFTVNAPCQVGIADYMRDASRHLQIRLELVLLPGLEPSPADCRLRGQERQEHREDDQQEGPRHAARK